MKTSYSNPDYVKKVALLQQQAIHVNPPAIPFRRKPEKSDDEDETETKKIKIRIDPDDEESDELEVKAFIFEDGDAEKWIKWRIQFEELVRDMPLTDGASKTRTAKALLKGEARDRFQMLLIDLELQHEINGQLDAENIREEIFDEAIQRLGRRYFDSDQKNMESTKDNPM